jgi:hypothetical protein
LGENIFVENGLRAVEIFGKSGWVSVRRRKEEGYGHEGEEIDRKERKEHREVG